MALSVENWGAAKTPKPQTRRRVTLEATPPEKTTSRPGCCFCASRVVRSTTSHTDKTAKAAVSSGLFVLW